MRNILLVACAALPLMACSGQVDDSETTAEQGEEMVLPRTTVSIDFDQVGGVAVADNSVVDTTYNGYGVTFGCVVCASGHAYARTIGNGTHGVSLVDPQASVLPFFDARDGAVTATFVTPRTWVSIDAAPVLPAEYLGTPTNMPWIEAFDANGNYLSETLYSIAYGQPGYGNPQTLSVSAGSALIKSVRFSSRHASGPAVYGTFDNLRYNSDPIIKLPPPRTLL
jgi:hypothetical protein